VPVAHPVTHANAILVLCASRGRRRNRSRNRPLGTDIFDADTDTDSDPEVPWIFGLCFQSRRETINCARMILATIDAG